MTERLPLRRPAQGRGIGGVCAGLAAHLGLPVAVVRLVMAALVLLGGFGAVLYVWLWVTVPAGDPTAAAAEQRPAALSRLAPRLRDPDRRVPLTDIGVGVLLLVAAGLAVAVRSGVRIEYSWVVPTLILLGGTALAWSQLDAVQRGRFLAHAGGRTPVSVVRLLAGTVLAGLGVFLLVGQDEPFDVLVRSAVAALAVLVGAAIVLAPWWLRLVRELGDERAARARESERADIAAHLHDSVLQTLALIQRQASDPKAVTALARRQERELRQWLYGESLGSATLAEALSGEIIDVEDRHGVDVELVSVGDCELTPEVTALVRAAREAMVNAAKHSGADRIDVYAEVDPELVSVYVRDRGNGFDLAAVEEDRMGVRGSIVERVKRAGGRAIIRTAPGEGTEVRLELPR